MEENKVHPSRFQLERWILENRTDASLSAHEKTCSQCHTLIEEIKNEQKAFLIQHPFSSFEAKLPQKKKAAFRGWMFKLAPIGAMAMVALLMIRLQPDEIRSKGSHEFGYYLKTAADPIKGDTKNGIVKPGDTIRFYVQSAKENRVLVLGIEENGKINLYDDFYFPTQIHFLFPESLTLDDSPNGELFIAVFSQEPLDAEKMKSTLAERIAELKSKGKTLADLKTNFLNEPHASFYLQKKTD